MGKFAQKTTVSASNSLNEIDRILERYGATQFFYGRDEKYVAVLFTMNNRRIEFRVPLPDADSDEFRKIMGNQHHSYLGDFSQEKYEQGVKQRYRALVLCIKAKLESVESNIESFEDAFLAHIVLPDGGTVGSKLKPQLEQAYLNGKMPPLLGSGG